MTEIHGTALIDKSVQVGENVTIGPYCIIKGNVTIGDNSILTSHVSIGEVPEHGGKKYENELGEIVGSICIEREVIVREFVTINAPMPDYGKLTYIGSRCYIMTKSHVGHDAVLQEDVVLASSSVVGGHSKLGKGSYLGLGSITHQFVVIGDYSMVAAGAFLGKNLPPFCTYIPGKRLKPNWTYVTKKFKDVLTGTKEQEMEKSMTNYAKCLKSISLDNRRLSIEI